MPPTLDFRILGPLEVRAGDLELPLGPAKQRAVLAMLLLHLNRVVPTEQIVEQLWPDRAPGRPQTAIQGYVSGLRKVLGRDAIETTAAGYVVRAEPDAVDVHRCESLLARGSEAGDPQDRVDALHEAARLWRGPALADFAYEAWAQSEIGRLEELRLVCAEERVAAELALGRHAELIGELESLTAAHPLRERLRGQLMTALYRSGRQAEALDAYHQARGRLRDELGIDPGPELQALYRQILTQDEALRVEARRPPPRPRSLIGRGPELDEITRLLRNRDVRLLTLTGPGGAGKTRLAREAAADVADAFPDGVCFVSLAAIREAELVLPAIAQALELPEQPGEPLATTVGARIGAALLVLDNLEQLVPAVAPVVADLIESGTLLATSRVRLNVRGEHELAVPPLSEASAAELFGERARAVSSGFEPDAAVATICRRVDCLPLALELAAARIKVLSTGELAERLERALPLLTGGPADLPERHRTLRDTIDWSYRLLAPGERTLLARLTVFAGGFSVAAAEAVAGADLDDLAALIDASLLQRAESPGEARFRMLETIREYAFEQLVESGESDRFAHAHARFFAALVERLDEQRTGAGHARAFDAIAREHDNVRAALDYAAGRADGELALRLATATAWFWFIRGHWSEGRRWLAEALALSSTPSALRAKALASAGNLAEQQREHDTAIAFHAECLALRRELGDETGVAAALNNLAIVHLDRGDHDRARTAFEESLELSRSIGDDEGIASVLCNLGEIEIALERFAEARPLLEEGLAVARRLEHPWGCALVLGNLGVVLVELDELEPALEALREALELHGALADPAGAAMTLERLAGALVRAGDGPAAARLVGAADALWRSSDTATQIGRERVEPVRELLAESLEPGTLAAAVSEGALLSLDAAVAAGVAAVRRSP